MSPSRDLAVIYLASHGSKLGELVTDLPDYTHLENISGSRLAQQLNNAGIRRRVIIVSACYAGSWIKPLATDNTIVVAAARPDRSSFGCSDERKLTFFGEAFLQAKIAPDASLARRFEAAKETVLRWETEEGINPHSEPRAFVGKNMETIWAGRLRQP